jgi:hypothetical protein
VPASTTLSTTDGFTFPFLSPTTPVLTRGAGLLQVGLDQEPSLVLAGMDPGMRQVLALLDGWHHRRVIERYGLDVGVSPTVLDWTLQTLADAGLLAEGPGASTGSRRRLERWQVRLIGAGPLGKAVAQLLVDSHLEALHVVDESPPVADLYPACGALGTRAQALRAHLGTSHPTSVRVTNHWSKPDQVSPALTIIASDQLECDRVVADGLLRADQPHLVLRARAGGVVVGPLVVPGETACLRCTDLTRRDGDPAWPTLLPQLMRMSTPVSPALLGWAAGVAAAQALAYLLGSRPESCGATIESAPADYVTRRRVWPMHPHCGCGWSSPAQWDP